MSTKNEPSLFVNSGDCITTIGGCLPALKNLIVAHIGRGSDADVLVELIC